MNNIKKLMEEQGVTFTDMLKQTGLSKGTVASLTKDDDIPENTKISTLKKVAQVLNIEIHELLKADLPQNLSNFKIQYLFAQETTNDITFLNTNLKTEYFFVLHNDTYFTLFSIRQVKNHNQRTINLEYQFNITFLDNKETNLFDYITLNHKPFSENDIPSLIIESSIKTLSNFIQKSIEKTSIEFVDKRTYSEINMVVLLGNSVVQNNMLIGSFNKVNNNIIFE